MFRLPALPDRLPPLRGRWMTAFVAIWLALLPVAVAMPLAGSWLRFEAGAGGAHREYPLGFESDEWRIVRVEGTEARSAGLRRGDRITAVEGIPVASRPTYESDYAPTGKLAAAEGQPVRLTVAGPGASARTIVLHHRAANAEPFYRGTGWTADSISLASAVVPLLPWLVLLGGAILLFGRRRDPGAALFSVTFLLGAHGVSWASLAWMRIGSNDISTALAIYMALGQVMAVGLIWALLTFPRGRFEPAWSAWIAMVAPVIPVALALGILPGEAGGVLQLVLIGLIVVTLAIRYRRETADERRQWRWALLGIPIGLGLIVSDALVYAPYLGAHRNDPVVSMWSWIITPGLLALGMAVISGGVLLSVLRYRIYAAQSAISRSLVYGALTLALLAIFAASEKVVELVGEEYFGESLGALAGGLGAAFAAVAIAPLHHRISRLVEQRLRKDLIALRRELPHRLESGAETGTPADVAALALAAIAEVLHAGCGAIVDGETVLASVGSGEVDEWPLTIILGHGGALRLMLGRKPDESLYDKDERSLLNDLSEPIARAVRSAARNRALDTRLHGIEQRLDALLLRDGKPAAA